MRYILVAIIYCSIAFADKLENIDADIKSNQAKIIENAKKREKITSALEELGLNINQQRHKLRQISTQIKALDKEIQKNTDKYNKQEKSVNDLKENLANLESTRATLQNRIIKLLLNDASFFLVLQQNHDVSPDDIMLNEIYKVISQSTKDRISKINDQEKSVNQEISSLTDSIKDLQVKLDEQNNRKNLYATLQVEQENLLEKIKGDLYSYNQQLLAVENERKSLNDVLEKLNILKSKETQKSQQKVLGVKQVATSYKKVLVAKYRGQKTIPPFENYKILQRFGNYLDPIYNLKVFNESVILGSQQQDEQVRSIFNGKVVYANEVPLLKKVVIVENQNNIHTIYAQLDKIAPTIKIGLKIKKGYVIGRVKNKLSFEITQKDHHINPLEVIQ